MSDGDIKFVNAIVDVIKCYCADNEKNPELIFNAISVAFDKEGFEIGDRYKAGNKQKE